MRERITDIVTSILFGIISFLQGFRPLKKYNHIFILHIGSKLQSISHIGININLEQV